VESANPEPDRVGGEPGGPDVGETVGLVVTANADEAATVVDE